MIESGALDFSLSGISNAERDKFAGFAWYFSNKYYLLVRQDAGVASQADFARHDKLQLGVIRSFRYSESANQLVDKLQATNRDVTSIIEFNDASVPHGLIMSKKALSLAEQDKWRALVSDMRRDGTMRRIFQKYFTPEMASALVDF